MTYSDIYFLILGKERQIYPSDPRGFIPNSVLVRLLFPEDDKHDKAEDTWRPPRLTDSQLAEIGQTRVNIHYRIIRLELSLNCAVCHNQVLIFSCCNYIFAH